MKQVTQKKYDQEVHEDKAYLIGYSAMMNVTKNSNSCKFK